MAFFDFFKKKEQPSHSGQQDAGPTAVKEPYLGDLNKTSIIYQLIQTPATERDEPWKQAFLENIVQASFRCGDPQVITGPDGFPYFQLFLPEPGKSFQCYVIERMKDDFLLRSGLGVVINPSANSADWVFSCGDILNLHLNNTFYTTTETPFAKETVDEVITADEKVMIAQPAETILPKQTRQLIAELLKKNGVPSPKVLLMLRHKANGVSQDIVFNLTPALVKDQHTYNNLMRAISWLLPRHYSIVGMDEKSLGDGFMPL